MKLTWIFFRKIKKKNEEANHIHVPPTEYARVSYKEQPVGELRNWRVGYNKAGLFFICQEFVREVARI